jgi:hypothetical protein
MYVSGDALGVPMRKEELKNRVCGFEGKPLRGRSLPGLKTLGESARSLTFKIFRCVLLDTAPCTGPRGRRGD